MKLLKWITGIFFVIVGLAIFTKAFVGGLIGVLLGVFILPPSHQLILDKLKLNLSRTIKWVIFVGVFIVMCLFVNKSIPSKENQSMNLIINAEKLIEEGKDTSRSINGNTKALAEIRKEPKVKEALITDANVLYVSVIDDGTRRDGYAEYLCQILADNNATMSWVKVIKVNSSNDPSRNNSYGILLGENHCD